MHGRGMWFLYFICNVTTTTTAEVVIIIVVVIYPRNYRYLINRLDWTAGNIFSIYTAAENVTLAAYTHMEVIDN